MGFFEDAVITVKKAGKTVGEKATEVYDVSKKKISSAEIKNKIKAAYADMGKLVYEAKKNNINNDDKIAPYITLVDDLNLQMQRLQEEIDQIKNVVTCENCEAVNPLTSEFCSKCGAKLPK